MNEKTLKFISKAKEIHKNKFDYSLTEYKNSKTKVKIICPIHGVFEQTPEKHLMGRGCPKCGIILRQENYYKNFSLKYYIDKIRKVHGDNYDYSLIKDEDIKNKLKNKLKIVCFNHGLFEINYRNFLSGQGCPKCGHNKKGISKRMNKEEYIKKCLEIHNNKYDYSLVDYQGLSQKIKIICPKHGIFEQKAGNHLYLKQGCPKCKSDSLKLNQSFTTEEIIKKLKILESKYDYSKVEYINSATLIKVICPIHGEFEVRPYNFIYSHSRCPKCSFIKQKSKAEKEIIDFIKEKYNSFLIISDRNIIKPYELDVYIPDKNIAFEFDGLYWHSEACNKDKSYHLNKSKLCNEKGIQLIHIFEDEWKNKKQIVKSRIKHLLGITKYKIYARLCEVKEINTDLSQKFIDKYHIQGSCYSKYNFGLFYKNRLVACMTFNKPRFNKNYDYELIRYCTVSNFTIIGGASKLLKYFRQNNSGTIISYADKRWSNGNLYKQLGFNELEDSKPNYFYVKNRVRYSRVKFQKHKLKNLLEKFDEKLSEYQNMVNNRYTRIWDCGNKVFELK